MEKQLRQIWANVLSLEPDEVGAEDNLFELGGDSVKAILIMAKAAEQKLYFDIQTLFANPSVGSLAKAVSQAQIANGHPLIGVDQGDSTNDDDILQRVQHRMEDLGIPRSRVLRSAKLREDQVDFIEMTAQGAIGASPVFIYEVNGSVVLEKLGEAITALTLKHPMLRTTFVDIEDAYYQVLLADASPTLLVRSCRITEYAHEASTRVLAAGDPTVYYALINDHGTLYFTFSVLHCFFDSFSRVLIEQDLMAALESPKNFVQQPERLWYGDFAKRLDADLDEPGAEAFWRRYLDGTRIETIHHSEPGPKRRFDRSIYETVSTDVMQGRQIHLATAITTAWALALMHKSGFSDVAFTLLTLGRLYPYEGIDRLVGLLVKDRPFRVQVQDSAATIESVLLGVQGDIVSAGRYEHAPRSYSPTGMPCVQSYVNIKLGGSEMPPTTVGGVTLIPRRDLERWESETNYAVYLEMKPLGYENRFEMRYHSSLIDGTQAAALLRHFVALLKQIGCSSGAATVGSVLGSVLEG